MSDILNAYMHIKTIYARYFVTARNLYVSFNKTLVSLLYKP